MRGTSIRNSGEGFCHPEVPEARQDIGLSYNSPCHPEFISGSNTNKHEQILNQVQNDKIFGSLCKVRGEKYKAAKQPGSITLSAAKEKNLTTYRLNEFYTPKLLICCIN